MTTTEKITFLKESIKGSVSDFESISLHQMSSENQMTRYDKKYIFRSQLIPEIISHLKDCYCVLEIDGKKLMSYQSEYYDTEDYQMYNEHHNGKVNRFKIRLRKYIDTGETFLEIKRKTNKGLMVKRRTKLDDSGKISPEAKDLIEELTHYKFDQLRKTLKSEFFRLTLQNNLQKERVTIDCFPELSLNGKNISLPGLGIMEIKKCNIHSSSIIEDLLKEKSVYSTNFSKYCTGMALLNDEVKSNNFKNIILTLKKIENEFLCYPKSEHAE